MYSIINNFIIARYSYLFTLLIEIIIKGNINEVNNKQIWNQSKIYKKLDERQWFFF